MSVRLMLTAVLCMVAAPALAQTGPAPLPADASSAFVHANSGMRFPVSLLDLKRGEGQEYAKPQLDIAFRYFATDNSEEISVYVYRATAGSPAIWFDAASRSIELRQSFGRKTRVDLPTAFTPPGQTAASGFKAAWTLSDGPYRSTALAIIPVGEWLVKLRYSSAAREAASLVTRLDAAIVALGWPEKIAAADPAMAVSDCPTALKLSGKSKPVKADGATALLDAMTGSIAKQEKVETVTWCRDTAIESPLPVYRPVGTDNAYLASLSDSGHAVWVRPSLGGLIGDRKPSWATSIVLAGETINYPGRDRLPPPTQLNDILKGAAASRVTTWGDKRDISIDSSQIK